MGTFFGPKPVATHHYVEISQTFIEDVDADSDQYMRETMASMIKARPLAENPEAAKQAKVFSAERMAKIKERAEAQSINIFDQRVIKKVSKETPTIEIKEEVKEVIPVSSISMPPISEEFAEALHKYVGRLAVASTGRTN